MRTSATVERKRRDFVTNASHELKTPIAALIGMLDLMELVSDEKRADLMERSRRNAQSLARMTEDLLGNRARGRPGLAAQPTPGGRCGGR